MTCNLLLNILVSVVCVLGHGRVLSPAGRSTAWRLGYDTPVNFNDAEIFCGGFYAHYYRNHGKCGICGDAYDQPTPRDQEIGGKYGTGLIVANYKPGSVFTAVIQLTAFHKGYWEFKLCPDHKRNDQECFDQYLLELESGNGTKFYPSEDNAIYYIDYRLPSGLICDHCVLQWTYIAGNNWGVCKNGTGALGCGNQEHFLACSDIKIDISATASFQGNQHSINYSTLSFMPANLKLVYATEKQPDIPDVKYDQNLWDDNNLNYLGSAGIVSTVEQSDMEDGVNDLNNVDEKTSNLPSEDFEDLLTAGMQTESQSSVDVSLLEDSKTNITSEKEYDTNQIIDNQDDPVEALEDITTTDKQPDNQNTNSVETNCNLLAAQCPPDELDLEEHYHDEAILSDQHSVTNNQLSFESLRHVPYPCVPYVKWALLEFQRR